MMKPIGNRLLIKNWPQEQSENKLIVQKKDTIQKRAVVVEVSAQLEAIGIHKDINILYDSSGAIEIHPTDLLLINYEDILCVL